MKKLCFLLSVLMIVATSCLDYSGLDDEPKNATSDYFVKVNGTKVADNDTVCFNVNDTISFETFGATGNKVNGVFYSSNLNSAFGTGTIASIQYAATGTYKVTVNLENGSKTVYVQITTDAVILITASISGSTIKATLGFRCSAIPNFSGNKATYVAGEIPGISWKKYDVSETTSIGGIDYFKWNVSVPAGKFRLSWIQQKDAGATFSYDACNWAYDSASAYWNGTDYLFYFYLRIVNNKVIISANAS